ncbi:hypothetical protein [Armatimonas sp.]|uniref:hypothetical protein n=1 Tax=Armatimonas sp. TaxID=1872638 RepID=UPI003750B2D7
MEYLPPPQIISTSLLLNQNPIPKLIAVSEKENRISIYPSEAFFEECLKNISKSTKKCVICPPLETIKNIDNVFNKPDFKNSAPGSFLYMKEFCRFYNLSIISTSSNNILLSQNFEDTQQAPTLTYDEVTASLFRMKRIGEILNPQFNNSNHIKLLEDFLESASTAQMQGLQNGTPVNSLSDEQQQLIRSIIISVRYSNFNIINNIYLRMRGIKRTTAVFSIKNYYGLDYPVYSGTFSAMNSSTIRDVVMGRWVNTQPGGVTTFDQVDGAMMINGKIVSKSVDPTTPDPQTKLGVESVCTTLGSFYNSGSTEQKANLVLDPVLYTHPMYIIGDAYSNYVDIFSDISTIQKFYTKILGEKRFISYLPPSDINDLSQMRNNIVNCLPYNIQKFLNLKEVINLSSRNPTTYLKTIKSSELLYIYSTKRLRSLVENNIRLSKNNTLLVSQSKKETFDYIASSSLYTLIPAIITISNDVPAYLLDKEEYLKSKLIIKLTDVQKSGIDPHHYDVHFSISSDKSGGFTMDTVIPIKDE